MSIGIDSVAIDRVSAGVSSLGANLVLLSHKATSGGF
jgi:hypothetical protein